MSVHLTIGQILDGYQLVRFLGRGGFGEVWLCRSESMGGNHALKFISGSDPDLLEKEHHSLGLNRSAAAKFRLPHLEPIEPPWQAIKGWIPDYEPDLDWFNRPRNPSESDPDGFDQSPAWQPEEIQLGDGRTLVLDDT